jgi:hypothetical protein
VLPRVQWTEFRAAPCAMWGASVLFTDVPLYFLSVNPRKGAVHWLEAHSQGALVGAEGLGRFRPNAFRVFGIVKGEVGKIQAAGR